MLRSLSIVACAAVVAGSAVAADAAGDDISGPWVGTGFVQKDETSKPIRVNCAVEGAQDGDRIGFEGECRAMLVMRREIGAQLVRSGKTFFGTYRGAAVGVAELQGTETDPGTVNLTMTFPREVNGHRTARMTITRPGDGTFTIKTEAQMLSGATVTTSEITFARK
jgi:hypothetical protein